MIKSAQRTAIKQRERKTVRRYVNHQDQGKTDERKGRQKLLNKQRRQEGNRKQRKNDGEGKDTNEQDISGIK